MRAYLADGSRARPNESFDALSSGNPVITGIEVFFGSYEVKDPIGKGFRFDDIKQRRELQVGMNIDQSRQEDGVLKTMNRMFRILPENSFCLSDCFDNTMT